MPWAQTFTGGPIIKRQNRKKKKKEGKEKKEKFKAHLQSRLEYKLQTLNPASEHSALVVTQNTGRPSLMETRIFSIKNA